MAGQRRLNTEGDGWTPTRMAGKGWLDREGWTGMAGQGRLTIDRDDWKGMAG